MNLYFDNASTSFPKPPEVAMAIGRYLNELGGTYGRSAYPRVIETTKLVEDCRDKLASQFGTRQSDNISFCANATMAINTVLKATVARACHCWRAIVHAPMWNKG
jgi:selenocysteine lyase/cysteine desulfurase